MKQNPTAANLAASLAAYLTNNAPAGVNIRTKETREGLAVYILNAPAELIEWPELASNARRYAPFYPTQATAAGRDLYDQLRAIASRWSEDHGGAVIKGTTIWVGSPSRGFVPVAKDTPRPRQEKGGAPAIKYPRTLSARDRAIFAAIMAECEAVACRLHLKEGAPVPASFVELSERIGKDITGAPDAPRVVEVEGYRVECSAAALFGIAHRYARAFGIGYTAAPVCSLIAPAPAVEVEPLAVAVEVAASPVEVVPLAVAVEVNRAPRPSFRKVFARLVVALLSLIVAALRLLITCARLIERGRLLSVVASYTKGRAVRGRTVATRCAFVLRGRVGRRAAAVRSAVVGRVVAARSAVVGRLAAVWSRIISAADRGRLFAADCLFAARLRRRRIAAAVRGRITATATACASAWLRTSCTVARAANAVALLLIVAGRRVAAAADYVEQL